MGGRSRKVIERYRRGLSEFPYARAELLSRVVVVCHRHADVDAYCAAYGIKYILKRLAKRISISVAVPNELGLLAKKVALKYPVKLIKKPDFEKADLAVVVDTGHLDLLGKLKESLIKSNCIKVFLDHHPLNDSIKNVADYVVLNETATSTSEIVYDVLTSLNLPLSKVVAQVLLTGIIFDSQHLKLADYKTILGVSDLCRNGGSIGESINVLGSSRDRPEKIARLKAAQRLCLHLLGDWILGTTEVKSYHSSVARALLDLGVDVAVVVGQNGDESRCCLRSTQAFHKTNEIHLGRDVAEKVAISMDGLGGGHPTAASFNVKTSSKIVLTSVLTTFEDLMGLNIKKIS